MNNYPIGVFDSGVGGLSVLSEINKLLPLETTIYLADQAFMPYGQKSSEELVERVGKIISFFENNNVKAVVIACNTATIYTVEEMRKRFNFPIIGTVPVVKTISEVSKSKKTAVFSTAATGKSNYIDELIKKFANGVKVNIIGDSNLEQIVERGGIDSPEIDQILKKELLPLLDQGVDAIALGCTHYPFLKDKIQKVVGDSVAVLDSGGAVSRRLKQVLENENLLSTQKFDDLYYTTGDSEKFEKVANKLIGKEIKKVEHIDL